jgi:hypothetical protein
MHEIRDKISILICLTNVQGTLFNIFLLLITLVLFQDRWIVYHYFKYLSKWCKTKKLRSANCKIYKNIDEEFKIPMHPLRHTENVKLLYKYFKKMSLTTLKFNSYYYSFKKYVRN